MLCSHFEIVCVGISKYCAGCSYPVFNSVTIIKEFRLRMWSILKVWEGRRDWWCFLNIVSVCKVAGNALSSEAP